MSFHDGIFSDVESIPDSVAGGAVPLPAHLCDTQPEPAPLPPPANPQGKGTCCSKQAGLGVFWGVFSPIFRVDFFAEHVLDFEPFFVKRCFWQ